VTSRSERSPGPRLPLVVYLGVTLVAPALDGAIAGERFWEHAAITAAVSGAIAGLWLIVGRWRAAGGRDAFKGGR